MNKAASGKHRRGGLVAALAALSALLATGTAVADESPADTTPPETSFVLAPRATVATSPVRFEFASSEPGSRFECRLDGGPWFQCPSRVRYFRLARGSHFVEARAIDVAGNTDPTPAFREFALAPTLSRFRLSHRSMSRWAPVLRAARARSRPSATAPVVGRLTTRTPEGTTNLVLALERLRDRSGRLWVRVRLPILPNNRTGWVTRGALGGYTQLWSRLVIDRERLTATLYRYGRPAFRARVGVGAPWSPTPRGEFYVRVRVEGFDDPFYGPIAFGTSARSYVRTDWPGGGYIGIHGTSLPHLLPGRISNGCVRMRNEDVLRLAKLLRVGTPVTIR